MLSGRDKHSGVMYMKIIKYHTCIIIGLAIILFTCTKDPIFNPSDTPSVVCYAFLSDTLLSTITITDSSRLSTSDTIHTADSVVCIAFIVPPDGNIKSARWDFGDGSSSDTKILWHKYTKGGVYFAVFTIEDNAGFFIRDTVVVHVNTPPDTVLLLMPENGQSYIDPNNDTRMLRWSCKDADGDTLFCDLFFDTTKKFQTPILQTKDTAVNIVEFKKLIKLTTYYWMVKGIDRYGDTALSDTFWFRTKDPDIAIGSIDGYALFQGWIDHRGIKISIIDTTNLVNPQYTSTDHSGYFYKGDLLPRPYKILANDTIKQVFIGDTGYARVMVGTTVSIDTMVLKDILKPVIANNNPTDTQSIRRPQISASFSDITSGILSYSACIELNDSNYTNEAVVTNAGITWTPGFRLCDGMHRVKVTVSDSAGNEAVPKAWNFNVDAMKLYVYGDTTVSINDAVNLSCKVMDVYSRVVMYKWDFAGNGLWTDSIATTDTMITKKNSYSTDAIYKAILYVRDDSGMVKFDTAMITVLRDAPVVNLGKDTTVSINDTIRIKGTVTQQFGTVLLWWNINNSGFIPAAKPDTVVAAPAVENPLYQCIHKAQDDDGNIVYDTLNARVEIDQPKADISVPEYAHVDSTFTVKSSGSTPGKFGHIVKYELSIGAYDAFKVISGSDTLIYSDTVEMDSFIVVLRITDDDGNLDSDTAYVRVCRFWAPVGNKGFSDQSCSYTSLGYHIENPIVAYWDGALQGRATVMKYNGTSWTPMGNTGFSDGGAYNICLSISSSNIPYAAFGDNANGMKITVMRFNGTLWEPVGYKGISDGSSAWVSLAVYNNTPYVAYSDYANSNKTTVMYFNGILWEAVGIKGISDGAASYQSLTVYNSIVYVAFRDELNGNKTTVIRYNGTSWELVGSKGFSDGAALYQSIAIDNGTPYVAYRDEVNGSKTTVMRFNGTLWEAVGIKGISDGAASYQSLAVYNGIPYVAYGDEANGFKTTVMRLRGASWSPVGIKGFSDGVAFFQSLAINNGTLYLAFRDEANGMKTTVMRYR